MYVVAEGRGHGCHGSVVSRAAVRPSLVLLLLVPLIAGCVSHWAGPDRAITADEDIASIRPLALQDPEKVQDFYQLSPAAQASVRNQVITARMYLIDVKYDHYEAALTQELQTEGLGATLASLGLTTTASLIPVEQTSRLLAGIATGVTGADKAYSEKELLNETMQALQTQMRADRKAEAATIYAKMLMKNGAPTSIDQYTLPMALSDTDHYYDAGTISSALIGLSKTVSNAEQNADAAKAAVSPNAQAVTAVKAVATPLPSNTPAVVALIAPLTKSSQHIAALPPVRPPTQNDFSLFERNSLSTSDVTSILKALCVSPAAGAVDFGPLNSSGRLAIAKFKAGIKNAPMPQDSDTINSKTAQADETVAGSTLVYLRRAVTIANKEDPANSRCTDPKAAYTLGQEVAGGVSGQH